MPVQKQAGDEVIGGTANHTGSFLMDKTRCCLRSWVAGAQCSRAPIDRIIDIGADILARHVIAIVTFILWVVLGPKKPALAWALVTAVAVLIITYQGRSQVASSRGIVRSVRCFICTEQERLE